MADCVISVAGQVAPYLWDPIISQLKYLFCFSTNIHNLNSAIEELRGKRAAVQLRIDAKRGDEVTGPDVLIWLKNVDETDEQAKNTLEAIEEYLCNVRCANIKSRYDLGWEATKIYKEISELREKGNFVSVVCPAPLVQLQFTASRYLGVFESRMSTRKQVMEALRDSSTSVIGICGMAGVGKTVMAKEIADLVMKENVFDKVFFVVVSRNQESEKEKSQNQLIMMIQDKLAAELKFSLSENIGPHARKEMISTVIQKERDQRVLIILDDLWEDLDLEEIGIPTIDLCKGLKVLLTSRFSDVCQKTGAKKNIFEVEVLNEEEAWHLFKETAGISDDATGLVGIAKEVAKQCARLPLAIVIVAKALENKKVESAWSDALKQLEKGWVTNIKGVHDFVYSRIEWSYNYLENKEAKSVLLLCSLFPEDFEIPIEVLVMYVKGLELFEGTDKMKETRDRMVSVILDLKNCYLLLNGEDENFVKMHDVVRDVCLIISSQLGYKVSNYGTMEGPKNRDNRPYTAASLTIGQLDQLPSDLDYSRLELLRMSYENWEKQVLDLPVDILQRVNSLKVLYFEKVNLRSPLSLQPLKSICSLFLHGCKLDRNVSTVSGLDNLQILSFLGCDLLEFPKGIENLGNLKSLNLMFKTCPDPLPKGVLIGLKKLEELYLENYFKSSNEDDAHGFDEQHAEEINSLSHLNVLVVSSMGRTISQEKVLKRLPLADMTRFYIGYWDLEEIFQFPGKFQKIMKVRDIDGAVLGGDPNVGKILRKTECLGLERAKGLRNVVPELEEDGFVNLRELKLEGGDYSKIIDATDSTNFFHNLQDLRLWNLNNLIEISNGKMGAEAFHDLQRVWLRNLPKMKYLWRQPPSLCNLTVLDVRECPEISYLFSQSILKCLVLLQQIDIRDCANLEEIVCKEETSTSGGTEILVLPKLQRLDIRITKFRRFWNDDSGTNSSTATQGNLQAMLNRVSLPDMTHLHIFGTNGPEYVIGSEMQIGSLHQLRSIELWYCSNLKSFFVPLMASHLAAQLLPSLEEITIQFCESIQVLWDFEGIMTNNNIGDSSSSKPKPVLLLFDGLQRISLMGLDGLQQIWRMPRSCTTTTTSIYVIKAFQNLKTLSVDHCGSLTHLLSVSMAQILVGLEELKIEHCDKMEEVIAAEAEEGCRGGDDDDEDDISNGKMGAESFGRLQRLKLQYLPKMKYLLRHSIQFQPPSLCNLTVLKVGDCPEIRYLFSQPILKCLVLLQQIEIWKCENLEEIVCKEETSTSTSTSGGTEILVLPKLQSLSINRTKFRRFWNDDSGTNSSTATTEGNLQAMLNRVSLPDMTRLNIVDTNGGPEYVIGSEMQIGSLHQLRSIEVVGCSNLKRFFVPLMASHLAAQLLPSLEVIRIWECESIQVLWDFEGMMKLTNNNIGDSSSSKPKPVLLLFDGLQLISLVSLAGLQQIWRMPRFYGTTTTTSIYVIKAFQNLKTLFVYKCGSLRHLLSVSMAQMLVGLEELRIWDCNKMEEVIAAEEEEGDDDDITTTNTNIELLPKLRSIQLDCLLNLQVVFGIHNSTNTSLINNSNIHRPLLILPSLHQLTIVYCRMLTKFCVGSKLSAPKLEKVKVDGLIPEDLKDTGYRSHIC